MGRRKSAEGTVTSPRIDEAGARPAHLGFATRQGRFIGGLSLLLLLVGLVIYGPTLRLAYAYDDIDHLNLAADYLSGRMPFLEMLWRPHHEHVVPAFRLLVAMAAAVTGTDATLVRIGIFLAHAGGAILLSILVLRLTERRGAALATGVAYILPAGLSSMFVWFPSGGIFPLGTLGIVGAAFLVTIQADIGRRRALVGAGAGILLALLLENGLFPLAAGPSILDEIERRRDGKPSRPIGALTAFSILVSCAAVVATLFLHAKTSAAASTLSLSAVLPRIAFLVLSAPFRMLFPAQHLPRLLGSPEGSAPLLMAYGAIVWAFVGLLLAGLYRARYRSVLVAASALALGPLGFVALVALARSGAPPTELFDSDRYYFPLLVPLALVAGFATASIADSVRSWPRVQRMLFGACLAMAVGGQLAVHVVAVWKRVPVSIYDAHARRFAQLRRLNAILGIAATSPRLGGEALEIPDGAFRFEDVHNHRLSTRFLLFVAGRSVSERIRLASSGVGPASEEVLNAAFAQWASEAGDKTLQYRVSRGQLRNAGEVGMVRFTSGPEEQAVGEGFYEWERLYRWMSRRGTLRLVVAGPRFRLKIVAPLKTLSRHEPGLLGMDVEVSIQASGGGQRVRLGTVHLSSEEGADAVLPLPGPLFEALRDQPVTVTLESSYEWRPREVLTGSADDRRLSIQVFEAGFTE